MKRKSNFNEIFTSTILILFIMIFLILMNIQQMDKAPVLEGGDIQHAIQTEQYR